MGGHQVPGRGPGDDGYDEDGYDESQRAQILEVTRSGPTDGLVLTDLDPDLGEDIEADEDDEFAAVADDASGDVVEYEPDDDDA